MERIVKQMNLVSQSLSNPHDEVRERDSFSFLIFLHFNSPRILIFFFLLFKFIQYLCVRCMPKKTPCNIEAYRFLSYFNGLDCTRICRKM